ncbi:MAG: hypothetical protein WDN31_12380 [Hyphomicrobium sp.]
MVAERTETFEPEDLKALGSIFDETWAAIAAGFDHADEATRTAARTRLACLLLQLAGDDAGHDHIKQAVVHIFRLAPVPSRARCS